MNKITFMSDEILPSLAMVSSVVNPKNSLPILNDVRIETKDDGNGGTILVFMASDSETWLQKKATCEESDKDVAICIEAKSLLQALRNLGGKRVEMTIDDDKHTVLCSYGNGRFSLPFDNANEFPLPIATIEDAKEKRIDAQKLLTAIEKAGFATANDELRPVMNGVHFDFYPYGMVTCATDGHKLAKYTDLTITFDGDANPVVDGYTLPKKPCHTLISVLANTVAGDVKISFNDRLVAVNNTMFKMTTRLIEGRYPNYDAVIPKENNKIALVDKAAFVSALKRVLPMGNSNSELVALGFNSGNMTISAEDFDFSKSASEDVCCDYTQEPFSIGFKGSVLLQMLQNIDGDVVRLAMSDASRAGVISEDKSHECYDYTSIIMPMLLNN
jgi:DNA polymerase-3 subunit beta